MFDEINTRRGNRRGSRDGAGKKNDSRAKRTYRFRGRVLCDCGRRMAGIAIHERTYYRCCPGNNNRGRPDRYAGHPAAVYMREDAVVQTVNEFFAQRVFGAARRSLFETGIDGAAETEKRDREERRARLQRSLADTARKQDNVLRQAEDADPTDPFTQGLRDRFNELETARRTVLATIAELDAEDERDRDRPNIGDVDLLDVLPHLAVNLHRAPAEALERLFSLTQLTIDVPYKTGEATLKITLPAGHMNDIAATAEEMSTDMPRD